MSNFLIRECNIQDSAVILTLWREAEATVSVTDTLEDLQRLIIEGPGWVLVAESDGQMVGTVIGTFDGWRGNIYRLAVHPASRRKGIARALIAETETRLTRQGARRITALVEKQHPWATAFWNAVGYELDSRMVRFTHTL